MYADYFGLQESPFNLTPDTAYFFLHKGQQEALNVLLVALHDGEGLMKVTGEVGTGKTLLCRKLMNSLGPEFHIAYLPNPALQPNILRMALAEELGLDTQKISDQHHLLKSINQRLMELADGGKRTVVFVDEAQSMPDQTLEALRLLTNLETEKEKLVQIVLFGQPELNEKLAQESLRQVRQRIAFSYELKALASNEVAGYINHRLIIAGFQGTPMFLPRAIDAIYQASRGVPRVINMICNKAMILAYGRGDYAVRRKYVAAAARETDGVKHGIQSPLDWIFHLSLGIGVAAVLAASVYLWSISV